MDEDEAPPCSSKVRESHIAFQRYHRGSTLFTLSAAALYNLRVNALWHHSILSDNVADNVAPEQSSAPVLLVCVNKSTTMTKKINRNR